MFFGKDVCSCAEYVYDLEDYPGVPFRLARASLLRLGSLYLSTTASSSHKSLDRIPVTCCLVILIFLERKSGESAKGRQDGKDGIPSVNALAMKLHDASRA